MHIKGISEENIFDGRNYIRKEKYFQNFISIVVP